MKLTKTYLAKLEAEIDDAMLLAWRDQRDMDLDERLELMRKRVADVFQNAREGDLE